jgi:phage-related protein
MFTHKYASDVKVVRLLRTRRAGYSSTQLFRKLEEEHEEVWLSRCAKYLSDCQAFTRTQSRGILVCLKTHLPELLFRNRPDC